MTVHTTTRKRLREEVPDDDEVWRKTKGEEEKLLPGARSP